MEGWDIMPAAVETMVSAREVPWHGLGVVTPNNITTGEAIELAQLDWTVDKEPVYRKGIQVPNKFFTVRSSDDKILGIVGPDWQPLQNRDAFTFADNLVDSGEALVETAGSLRGGRVVFVTMKFPQQLLVDGQDAHDMYLLLRMGHDGTMAIKAEVVTIRVVCMNTLVMASLSAKQRWSIIHTQKMEGRIAEAREALKLSWQYAEKFVKAGDQMVATKFSDDDLVRLLDDIIPNRPKKADHIENIVQLSIDSPTNPYHGTAWGAFNAITEYYDHCRETRSIEGVFTQIMDGEISSIRKKAERVLLSV